MLDSIVDPELAVTMDYSFNPIVFLLLSLGEERYTLKTCKQLFLKIVTGFWFDVDFRMLTFFQKMQKCSLNDTNAEQITSCVQNLAGQPLGTGPGR